jgi:basic membrane protein A
MKKLFTVLLICLPLCFVNAGGKQQTPAQKTGAFKVLLISNLEGDKSFADSAILGAKKAIQDFGVEISYSQSGDPAEYENQVITGAEEGFDLVVAAASQWQDAIEKHCASYPNVMFGITDTNAKGDNVVSVVFAQNQGSFLAGAAAAMFTTMTAFPNVNSEATIGWVGGVDIPALRDFFIGYTEGARYINPNIKILQSFAGDWYDPLKGKELTTAMYEQGADIVMNVASATGNGVLEAAKENNRYAIGVDMNQDGDQPGAILTSMLKENGQGVYYIIKKALEEKKFTGNQSIYMDLQYGGVNLTDMSVFKGFCNAEQKALIDQILTKIEAIKADIASGKIVVSNYEGYGPNIK